MVCSALGLKHDLTQCLKQWQNLQSEKMSVLGNLVAGLAHEINNPVGFLKGNIQPALANIQDLFGLLNLYQEKYPNPDRAIQDEMEAIDTLLILKHRLKSNEFRPEINVIKNYGNIPPVECFAGQLNQVFMNLLANAIDALE